MAIQISNWVTELQKRTNLQGTDRILMGLSDTGESLYTTVADLAGVVTGSTVVNRGNWASGTEYTQGDYVFAESTASPSERSMYFLIGLNPYVSNIPPKDDLSKWSELPAIKGDQGPKGDKGDKGDPLTWDDLTPTQKDSLKGDVGDSGWSMLVRAEVDNVNLDSDGQYRKVLYVYDWVGGEGTKPTITGYIGVSGIVANIINAENWRGSRGAQGIKGDAPAHEWVGTSVRFQNPNGTWGSLTDLRGVQGLQGVQGDPPAHEWNGSSLRFQNPDGSWGAYVDLRGEKGDMGDGLEIGASGPLSGRSAYDSEPVNFVYWATDENLFYIRANPTGWSTGQSLGAVANFLQLDDTPSSYSGSGGKVVAVKNDASGLEFVDRGVPYTGATSGVDLNTQNFSIGGEFNRGENVFDQRILQPGTTYLYFRKLRDVAVLSRTNDLTTEGDIVISFPITTSTAWIAKIQIARRRFDNVYLQISAEGTTSAARKVSVISGDADYISSVKIGRIGDNTVLILKRDDRTFTYGKVTIEEFHHFVTYSEGLSNKSNYKIEFIKEEDLVGFTLNGTVTNAEFTRDPFYAFKTDIIGTAGQLPFTNSGGTGIEKRKIAPADLNIPAAGTILGNVGGNLTAITLSTSATNNSVAQRTATGQLKASSAVANDDLVALGQLITRLNDYVLKEAGKGLSTNDFTAALLDKLNGIATGATANQADAYLLNRANHTGTQEMATITGLIAALADKVDKVTGKGLSTEDYTTADKNKVDALGAAASKDVGVTEGDVVEVQADGMIDPSLYESGGGIKGAKEVVQGHEITSDDNGFMLYLPAVGGASFNIANNFSSLPINFMVQVSKVNTTVAGTSVITTGITNVIFLGGNNTEAKVSITVLKSSSDTVIIF